MKSVFSPTTSLNLISHCWQELLPLLKHHSNALLADYHQIPRHLLIPTLQEILANTFKTKRNLAITKSFWNNALQELWVVTMLQECWWPDSTKAMAWITLTWDVLKSKICPFKLDVTKLGMWPKEVQKWCVAPGKEGYYIMSVLISFQVELSIEICYCFEDRCNHPNNIPMESSASAVPTFEIGILVLLSCLHWSFKKVEWILDEISKAQKSFSIIRNRVFFPRLETSFF